MNKKGLCEEIKRRTGISEEMVEKVITNMSDIVAENLRTGDKVQIVGFGAFEVKERPARKARNPKTGAEIEIDARRSPMFKPGKKLKEAVID